MTTGLQGAAGIPCTQPLGATACSALSIRDGLKARGSDYYICPIFGVYLALQRTFNEMEFWILLRAALVVKPTVRLDLQVGLEQELRRRHLAEAYLRQSGLQFTVGTGTSP